MIRSAVPCTVTRAAAGNDAVKSELATQQSRLLATAVTLSGTLDGDAFRRGEVDTGSLRGDLVEFSNHVRPFFNDPATRTLFGDVFTLSIREPNFGAVHKQIMDERGIEIPFPHQTIFFGENKDGTAPALRLRNEDPA